MKKVRKSLALLLTLAMVSTFVIPVAALPGGTLGVIDTLTTYTSTVYVTTPPYSGTTYLDGNGYTTPVAYTGVQNIQFDVTPLVANCDGVIAYADADRLVGNFNDLAMLVRMNDTGTFDVRNGAPGNNTQQALVAVPYVAGQTYHIEISSDIATMKYDVWVTTPDGTKTKIAEDYGYRTASQAFTNDVGQVFFATGTAGKEFQVKNHMIRPEINSGDVYTSEVYTTDPLPRTNANFLQGLGLVIGEPQTGIVKIECTIVPGLAGMDQNFGFADSGTLVKAFNDLAMQVRMNDSNLFDVRSGGGFVKLVDVPYTVGTAYNFEIQANMITKKYNVWVTPDGGVRTALAANCSFRAGGAGALSDDIGQVNCSTSTGTKLYTMGNFEIESFAPVNPEIGAVKLSDAPVTPTGFTAPLAGQTITWTSSDPAKATIDPATGVITGVGFGNTTISYVVTDDTTGLAVAFGSTPIIVTENVLGDLDTCLAYDALVNRSKLPGYSAFSDPNPLSRTAWNLGTANTGIQEVQFDITPKAAAVEGYVAYTDSTIEVKNFDSFAMLVGLNTDGFFTVRNADADDVSTIAYNADTTYRVRMRANLVTKTYSVFAKDLTNAGEEVPVIVDAAFNTKDGSAAGANTDDIGKVCFIQQTYPANAIFSIKNHTVRAQLDSAAVYTSTKYTVKATVDNPWNFLQNIGCVTDEPKTGLQLVAFDFTANADALDQNIGYADSSTLVNVFNDIAMQVRFTSGGYIDCRNGGGFARVNTVNYVAGQKFHIEILADMDAKTYSVFVTPDGLAKVQVAANYAFRAGGAGTSADDIGQAIFNTSNVAKTYTIENHTINTFAAGIVNPTIGEVRVGQPDVTPTGFIAPDVGETITWTSTDANIAQINPVTGNITAVTAGNARIYYTVNDDVTGALVAYGSTDVEVLPEVTLGVLDSTATYEPNLNRSVVPSYDPLVDPGFLSGTAYTSSTVNAGKQNIQFDLTTVNAVIDGVIGYSDTSTITQNFDSFAMMIKMTPEGVFAVQNGAAVLESSLRYTAGTTYHFEIDADMDAQTYSVWATPVGGATVNIATDCDFNDTVAGNATNDIGRACFVKNDDVEEATFTVAQHMIRPQMDGTATYDSALYSIEAPFTNATYLFGSGVDLGVGNTGKQYVSFDVTPSVANTGASICFADSSKSVGNYNDCVVQVRMNSSAAFDVRNGGVFAALETVNTEAGKVYNVEILADMNAKTYSVWVTPQGGAKTQIAADYGFRLAAAPTTDDLGQVFLTQETADTDYTVSNYNMIPVSTYAVVQNPTVGTVQLAGPDVVPTGNVAPVPGEMIIWKSGNVSVATVDANTGAITPVTIGNGSVEYMIINALGEITATGSATFEVTPAPTTADKDAVTADTIKGDNVDLDNVIGALAVLPAVGSVNASDITWVSSDPLVVSNDGQTITRPVYGAADAEITLTATFTNGAFVETKDFAITVLALPQLTVAATFDVGATEDADALVANNMLVANTTITSNMVAGSVTALMIVALYDNNGAMVNVSFISRDIAAGGSETLSAGFMLPADVTGYTAKTFVWDGTDIMSSTMTPLSNVVQIGAELPV